MQKKRVVFPVVGISAFGKVYVFIAVFFCVLVLLCWGGAEKSASLLPHHRYSCTSAVGNGDV